MNVKQYDAVTLKDGRNGTVVEVLGDSDFIIDVGSGPEDWDTINITIDMIDVVNDGRK